MKTQSSLRFIGMFLIPLIAGILIWGLSPVVLGEKEPWDFPSKIPYFSALFATGVIAGLFSRARGVLSSLLITAGILLGQFCFILVEGSWRHAPLFIFGLVFLVGCSLLTLFGALMGAGFVSGIRQTRQSGSPVA